MKIEITATIAIDDSEISETFIRSSGPGGQNVNKVSTAVQLRFDIAASPNLPEEVKTRLYALAGSRLTIGGVLLISASRYRSQDRNRQDAVERLVELIRQACLRPVKRRKTKPSLAARTKRLESKKRRSDVKKTRGKVDPGHS